jgi:hypothetical protein
LRAHARHTHSVHLVGLLWLWSTMLCRWSAYS